MSDSDYLEYIARLTIFGSIFIVIYLCSYVVWRIYRFPNPAQWKYTPIEIQQELVEFPFKFSLNDASSQTQNEVVFNLKCNKNSHIHLIWGIEMSYLVKLMNSPWSCLTSTLKEIDDKKHVPNDFLAVARMNLSNSDAPLDDNINTFEGPLSVKPPSTLKWSDLLHKYRYPLVIALIKPCMLTSDSKSYEGSDNTAVGRHNVSGFFVILHVKNESLSVPTTVLAEYIKMNTGHTFNLKPLYVVEDGLNEDDGSSESPVNSESASEGSHEAFATVLCSVCQYLPVSRAILPCRHVCLCAYCFDKVERCPICRGQLLYYFKTRSEAYMSSLPQEVPVKIHRTWRHFFEDINERLNQTLGFT